MFLNIPNSGSPSWKDPVATLLNLPSNGNTLGDVRYVTSINAIYAWDGGAWIAVSGGGGGGGVWGTITGTLSNQTDLNTALVARSKYRSTYSGVTAYITNDMVLYNGTIYIAIANSTGSTPSSSPLAWTPFKDASIAFPIIAPETVSPAISYAFSETGNDTGMGSDTDGEIFWSTNLVERMRLNGSGDLSITGNFSSANFPIVGAVNTPTYFNSSGSLDSIPGWSANSLGEVGNYITRTIVDNVGGNVKIHGNETEFTTTLNTNAWSFANYVMDLHFDRSSNDFDFDNGISNLTMNTTMEGGGVVTNASAISSGFALGVGNPGTTTNASHANFNSSIGTGYTIDTFSGINNTLNVDNTSTINGNVNMDSINIAGNAAFLGNLNTGSVSVNSSFGGNVDFYNAVMTGDVGGNFRAHGASLNGNASGGVSGYEFNYNGTITGNSFNGSRLSLNGTADGYTGYYSNIQGIINNQVEHLTLNNDADVGGNYFALNGNNTGDITGDVLVVNYSNNANANSIRALNFSNSGTITQFFTGVSLSNSGTNDTSDGFQFNDSSTSTTRIVGLSANISGSSPDINGLSINVSSATSANRKRAATFEGGSIAQNADFETISNSPFAVDPINVLIPTVTIQSGTPITGTDPVMFLMGGNLLAQDDLGTSGFGLGFTSIANVGQIAVTVGKTVDRVSTNVAGFSVPDIGQGIGTITDVMSFRAIGALPAGGSVNIDNMYAFYADPFIEAMSPTNTWAFYDGTTGAENYLNKLAIGTTTKKVVNNQYGFNVDESLLSGFGDTNLVSGDLRALIRNGYSEIDPSTGVSGSRLNYLGTIDVEFTDDNATALINDYQLTKVKIASGKSMSQPIANHYSNISRTDAADDGTAPYLVNYLASITHENGATKTSGLVAGFLNAFHSIDGNGTVTDMYDFYAMTSSVGSAVVNRHGIHIEPDAGHTKDNWLSGVTLLGGASFTAPNETLRVSGDVAIAGNSKIEEGHFISNQSSAPAVAASANAGTGATASVSNATDIAGKVSVTTGTLGLALGGQLTVTFNTVYNVAPIVSLTPTDSNAAIAEATVGIYVTSTVNDFTINAVAALGISTTYTWNYSIIETQ